MTGIRISLIIKSTPPDFSRSSASAPLATD
jgi:hypothetical protein